jgi:hypothetical protein
MAWDPCVTCGKEFHGSTAYTYVTWHFGEERLAWRLRQCVECALNLRNGVSGTADRKNADGEWVPVNPLVERALASLNGKPEAKR